MLTCIFQRARVFGHNVYKRCSATPKMKAILVYLCPEGFRNRKDIGEISGWEIDGEMEEQKNPAMGHREKDGGKEFSSSRWYVYGHY